jgi:ariadne-1
LDQELYQKTEKKMEDMQQYSDLSWIEVQFLKKAVDVTVQCRTTLKWTYAFAFYLDKSNQTELFEVRIGLHHAFIYNNSNNE